MEEREYRLGFSTISGIGPAKFRKLLQEFGTAKAAWKAKKLDFSIENYLKELKKRDVWFLTLEDEDYPQLLKQIKNPPFVLYGRGDKSLLNNQNTICVVGARRTTQYGREVTKFLTAELVASGLTIVSGLALGVDAISHIAALENNGKTIVVLGCGVDCCNPRENQSIYDDILKSGNSPRGEAAGCIVSEFPLGMKPTQWTFPARNRIIAGLSQAVLVTEGAEDSGSLITAKFALSFGRRVFAVPGPIMSLMSKGPYALIQKGAKLVTCAKDVLDELKISGANPLTLALRWAKGDTEEENLVLKLLQNEPLHFDELVRRTKFDSSKLSGILSLMEIKGLIMSQNNGNFSVIA
jgi:DNA processing protein